MTQNPDPKPGRWLLPLVISGMVLFTWVFVTRLPGVEPVTTESSSSSTQPTTSTATTDITIPLDPALVAYRESLASVVVSLDEYQTEMATVNAGWDGDPRTMTSGEVTGRLRTLRDNMAAWASGVGQVVPPVGLESIHAQLVDAASRASQAASDVYNGFVSAPGPEDRRNALTAFDAAVADFSAAIAGI